MMTWRLAGSPDQSLGGAAMHWAFAPSVIELALTAGQTLPETLARARPPLTGKASFRGRLTAPRASAMRVLSRTSAPFASRPRCDAVSWSVTAARPALQG